MKKLLFSAWCAGAVLLGSGNVLAQQSVARQWDEEILNAIRIDTPRPPVHARNLFHLSAAMYDAWAAYDPTAKGYIYTQKETPTGDVEVARAEAISYAAYRVLTNRYALSFSASNTLIALNARMATLGHDPVLNNAVTGSQPFAVGNRIAAAVIAYGLADGANQTGNYKNTIGYIPTNSPIIVAVPFSGDQVTNLVDPNRWQALALSNSVTQNGLQAEQVQTAVCPHWGKVKPFCLLRQHINDVYLDRGPQPRLGEETDAQLKAEVAQVLEFDSYLDPDNTNTVDTSPAGRGNNSLGLNDGTGYPSNPVTGQPYVSHVVRRGDFGRVVAEFWADGPQSETPPGHWNVLANYVSDQTSTVKRIGGVGPIVSNLEWDVKMYFGLNASVHDAAIAAWNHKGIYDSARPLSLTRYMGYQGQSSDPFADSYHTNGLPLIPGLIELITTNTTQVGERHETLAGNEGQIAVLAWPGEPNDPTNDWSGVKWILANTWSTYQKKTFVTPPFPGLISGHSTFSRSAAEFMTHFTGSKYFPGGLGEAVRAPGSLTFEYGPSQAVYLQWATYYDAADEAGISRLWGGIHIAADDKNGRITGSRIGPACYDLAQQYFSGMPNPHPIFDVDIDPTTAPGSHLVSWACITGRQYRVETSTDLTNYNHTATVTAGDIGVTVTNSAPASGVTVYRITTGVN